jgi:O-antigen/teichoic acid export membrane protein
VSFFKQTGYLGVGLVLSGIGGLAMNVGLGRLLSGTEYGYFRVLFSSILIVGWLLSFGIERDITSRLSAGETMSTVLGSSLITAVGASGLFVVVTLVSRVRIISILGTGRLFAPFVAGCLGFLAYRFSMGILKGLRSMRLVGIQNVILGIGKASVLLGVAILGWQSAAVGAYVVATYVVVTGFALNRLGPSISSVGGQLPDWSGLRRILYSTSKQVGDVLVKFGGPVLVPVLGGSALDAGIFGGTLTLAFVPFYLYSAVIHNILPEISELDAAEDAAGIGRRIGFLFEVSIIPLIAWIAFGTLLGPTFVPLVYQSSFIISAIGSFLIFFIASIVIVSSLLTEILIGLSKEAAVARSWLVPLLVVPVPPLLFSDPLIAAGATLSIYISLVSLLLGLSVYTSRVPVTRTGFDYTVFK